MRVFIGLFVAALAFAACKKETIFPPDVNEFMECTIDSTLWSANSITADHNGDYLRIRAKHANGGSIEIRLEGPLQVGNYLAGISSSIVYQVDTYDNEIFHSYNVVQSFVRITSIDKGIIEGNFDANLQNHNGSKKLEDGSFRVVLNN